MKLLAVKMGLIMAADREVRDLKVYSDALGEVSKLNSSQIPANDDGLIISDIRKLCVDLSVSSICYISRKQYSSTSCPLCAFYF